MAFYAFILLALVTSALAHPNTGQGDTRLTRASANTGLSPDAALAGGTQAVLDVAAAPTIGPSHDVGRLPALG